MKIHRLNFTDKFTGFFFVVLLLMSLLPAESGAIPAFARKNKMACSACHTAWPMLNTTGHKFKENGYRFSKLEPLPEKITEDLSWDSNLPVSTIIVARPYDKKDSGKTKNRAIHEVELMVAGPMGDKLSGFIEIEAEDEVTNGIGFDTGIPTAALTYHHNNAVNLQFSWADLLWFDPYNVYTSGHRITRGFSAILDQTFGGADNNGRLRTSRQNVVVHGRPVPELFYALAYSGVADDSEGSEAATYTGRLAWNLTDEVILGALLIDGTCPASAANCAVERNYQRTAVDLEANFPDWVVSASYLQASDDNATATNEVENNAYFVQGLYAFKDNGRTTWAPVLRYDVYEKNNGVNEIQEMTFSLNYYFTENIRGMVEYWDRNGEGSTADDDRMTVQLFAAF